MGRLGNVVTPMPLHDELLECCRDSRSRGDSIDDIVRSLADVLTFIVITTAASDADAQHAVDRVAEYLTENIRTDYGKYHAGTATEKRGISCH